MPNARVSVDGEGLSKSTEYTVYSEDLLRKSVSGQAGIEALNNLTGAMSDLHSLVTAVDAVSCIGDMGEMDSMECLSSIQMLVKLMAEKVSLSLNELDAVSRFYTALCV